MANNVDETPRVPAVDTVSTVTNPNREPTTANTNLKVGFAASHFVNPFPKRIEPAAYTRKHQHKVHQTLPNTIKDTTNTKLSNKRRLNARKRKKANRTKPGAQLAAKLKPTKEN